MSVFAQPGEPVTDVHGNVICYVKNPLMKHTIISASDFHNFTNGNAPWKLHQRIDQRCVRTNPDSNGMQICINREWRP